MQRIAVVLPQPDEPRIARKLRSGTSNDRSSTASMLPKRLVKFLRLTCPTLCSSCAAKNTTHKIPPRTEEEQHHGDQIDHRHRRDHLIAHLAIPALGTERF